MTCAHCENIALMSLSEPLRTAIFFPGYVPMTILMSRQERRAGKQWMEVVMLSRFYRGRSYPTQEQSWFIMGAFAQNYSLIHAQVLSMNNTPRGFDCIMCDIISNCVYPAIKLHHDVSNYIKNIYIKCNPGSLQTIPL